MDLRVDAGTGVVVASADDHGLRVEAVGRRFDAPWGEVVAGYGPVDQDDLDGVPDAPAVGMLVLARGRGRQRFDPLAVRLPADNPEVAAFVDEVRRRVGDRWVGDGVDYPDLATRVFEPVEPGTLLGAVPRGLVVAAFLMAALGGWQLVDAGHVESPLVAAGIVVVVTVALLALFRLRMRR